MKYYFILILAGISFFLNSCEEEVPEESSQFTIDGVVESSFTVNAVNTGSGFKIDFENADNEINILTNDTIIGTYTISDEIKKNGSLQASLLLIKGGINYYAKEGSLQIYSYNLNSISGKFETLVISSSGDSIQIKGGSFADIQTDIISPSEITPEIIIDTLSYCYDEFVDYVQFSILMDAFYSNRILSQDLQWTEIFNHTQSSENLKVNLLWTKAYSLIYKLNYIIESAESIIQDQEEKDVIIAESRALRAYVFSDLSGWFGEIPLELNTTDSRIARNALEEVQEFVENEAEYAVNFLPSVWPGDQKFRLTNNFARALLARRYLNQSDYSQAIEKTDEIINSGNFALSSDPANLSLDGVETISGFESGQNTEYNSLIDKFPFVPVFRFSEILLIAAESNLNMGQVMRAYEIINEFRARRNEPYITPADLTMDMIYQQWILEMDMEGINFQVMKRFGKDAPELNLEDFKRILPVPISALDSNPNMTQNPGY